MILSWWPPTRGACRWVPACCLLLAACWCAQGPCQACAACPALTVGRPRHIAAAGRQPERHRQRAVVARPAGLGCAAQALRPRLWAAPQHGAWAGGGREGQAPAPTLLAHPHVPQHSTCPCCSPCSSRPSCSTQPTASHTTGAACAPCKTCWAPPAGTTPAARPAAAPSPPLCRRRSRWRWQTCLKRCGTTTRAPSTTRMSCATPTRPGAL